MKLIDIDKLDYHCNYLGDCMGYPDNCHTCDNHVVTEKDVNELWLQIIKEKKR